jgi:ABC-type transport system involved in multi-copper enzyme maturation permease subunit
LFLSSLIRPPGREIEVSVLLQIIAFLFLLLFTLPLGALAGGALLRAGCYLTGVRLPTYWKAGLLFLVSSAFSGGVGAALIYAGSWLGSGIGISPKLAGLTAAVLSLPLQCLISAAGYVYFLRISWPKAMTVWFWQLAVVVALGVGIWLLVVLTQLPVLYQLGLVGGAVVILAVLVRQGRIALFGPVLFYDLVRIARRSRYIFLRIAYAALLLLILWTTYASFMDRYHNTAVPAQEMAKVAGTFFFYFLIAQLAVVVLLTPAFTASAIAEEKDRKTLEFLLATDLRNQEIVLSKLASRYCNLGLLILTGLPVLSFAQFLGGVDPDLVLAGFVVTGVTMASLAALSILQSVYAKKPRDAIVLTYLGALGYVGLSSALMIFAIPAPGFSSVWNFGVTLPMDLGTISVGDAIETLNSGNIFVVYGKLLYALSVPGKNWAAELLSLMRNYTVFHLTVTLGCASVAVWKLRAVALLQTYGKAQKAPLKVRWFGRPRCGNQPMIWKEVFAEPGIRLAWFGRIVIGLLVAISMIPPAWIFIYFVWDWIEGTWQRRVWRPSSGSNFMDWLQQLGEAMNIWVRMAGTAVAILLLLAVAVRAATTVSNERDRQTMDSLLTTPLDSTTILFGKWLGSILAVRWGWLWLGLIWGIGLVTTGLHVLAFPLVVASWLVFAAFLSNLGLWFSAVCKTSLRATIWTIMTSLMCFGGHWLCWLCCIPIFIVGSGPGRAFEDVAQFQAFGLTPPVTLGWLAFQGEEFREMGNRNEPIMFIAFSLFGLVIWSAAALGLWGGTCARFRAISGRMPFRRRLAPPTLKPASSPASSTVSASRE